MPVLRLLVPWLLILALALANGALRELVLRPHLGDPWALLLSGLLLGACVVGVSAWAVSWLPLRSAAHALGVGVLWLSLTLLFEFAFGRAVLGKSWSELFDAYAFARGNLWPLVLLLILLSPYAIHRYRTHRRGAG